MLSVVTLRACLVAGGAALAVALTGCNAPATPADPMSGYSRLQLDLDQPSGGTDAGLITGPATLEGAPVACAGEYAPPGTWCDTPDPDPATVQHQLPEEAAGRVAE